MRTVSIVARGSRFNTRPVMASSTTPVAKANIYGSFTFGDGTTENPYAADFIRSWVKQKYNEELSLDEIRSMPIRRLRDRLIGFQEQFLEDGRVDKEIDQILSAGEELSVIAKAMNGTGPFSRRKLA